MRYNAFAFALLLAPSHLLLVLAKHRILGILIDLGFVLDVLGTVRVPKSRDRLVVVIARRTSVGAHQGLCVTSKTVLEDTGELTITVWNVRGLAINECRNDITECRKGQVNLGCLLEPISGSPSLGLTFGTGKIDQVELSNADVLCDE